MNNKIFEKLGKTWMFCDGGLGSLLQERGLKPGELPETWNLHRPDDVIDIARRYYEAGSDIVNTNTFGANRLKYPDNLKDIIEAAVANTTKARELAGRADDAFVALDIGPTGKLLQPLGDLSFDDAVAIFGEIAKIGSAAGADLALIETMADTYEVKAAVLGVKENSDLPIFVTMTYDETGKLLTGGDIKTTTALLEGLGVTAIGINCGLGPEQMIPMIKELTEVCSLPIIVNPNAGLPRTENGMTVYDVHPDDFSELMKQIAELGVHVLGGCCGTTPDHIRATVEKATKVEYKPPVAKHRTFVTSFSQCVEIGEKPVIIGERINPTGKKRFQQALRDNNVDYILSQAIEQEDCGAHILDVNVGLPEIDEPAMMNAVIKKLQSVTSLPLQIDTSDIEALEQGLRYYNGKPMVNSVNGKRESIEAIMPLVKKYGGVLVGLALDENGIPETADGRIEVADRIYEAADEYGISRDDIVIDGLAMTISSDTTSANTTLETLRRIRDERHGHSILGVSNISFGLPRREIVTSTFFSLAMQSGLSCAIVNPNVEPMMRAYWSYLALTDQDPQCMGYIEATGSWIDENALAKGEIVAADKKDGKDGKNQEDAMNLVGYVERGMSDKAREIVRAELGNRDAMDIINHDLIPALDKVGKGFEKGTVFLPQLLMSAEAAQAAFDVIKESMSGESTESKGTVILATVKNDIHDIGKNIVKVMLENYGYEVVDLGKDVPPELIVDTAIERDIKLVGLSALMTTTVASMEDTIKLLREKKPDTKVCVGGAVLTQEYADMIGADAYAKDAMETVRYADSVFGVS
ncbi:homocysteine S-methyltransferase family protein [Eubacterium xylanophilum]|uniref:homocysteine S-methyltransferase family protein n=1 Tax=Eubacterium xylanophilum TaxID=39497 RepID=UPI000478C25C|nr:homocysteine S-methyltransferase family protein [Eubacterium xylanophilum]